jgi:hypothetical protein
MTLIRGFSSMTRTAAGHNSGAEIFAGRIADGDGRSYTSVIDSFRVPV